MTIRRQIFLIALVFLLASPVVLSAGLRVWSEDDYLAEYYSKEISARVVDAEAGEPIEASLWNISRAYLEKYYKKGVRTFASYEEMQKYNTQQDPGWPNTYKPKLKVYTLEEIDSTLLNDLVRGRGSEEAIPKGSVRESIWDGRTIELRRTKDEDEYWLSVRRFQIDVDWNYYVQRPEAWNKIRNAALELVEAMKTMPRHKNYNLSTLPDDGRGIIYGEDRP